ncbi:MAG TPA: glycosyltransferase family 2 protein [Verrucomicrobiae bacterium]|nr:glycosyltransferase family 2 protein [Verrucomicrobiae bacterium]
MNALEIPLPKSLSIGAVLVTYQPDAAILDHVRRIAAQVSEFIVVDNASDGPAAQWIESMSKMPGVFLIRNRANLGIAAALNIGIRHALQSHPEWIVTFDQDTAVPENYFKRLLEAYGTCPHSRQVGMVVPGGLTEIGAPARPNPRRGRAWSFVPGAVNSGSLIKVEIFEKVGFYDEALFIDYVDSDFCLRLLKNGFKILSATPVIFEHELGRRETRSFFGLTLTFRVHTAWRYYYKFRNRLLLYRRYWSVSFPWFLRDLWWLFLELGRTFLLEHDRRPKVHATFQGLKDGLRGKSGRHPDFPPPQEPR